MPRNGRPPTSPHLKLIEGKVSRSRAKSQPKPRDVMPVAPDELDPLARAEWQHVAPELQRMGLLSEIDRGLVGAYCAAISTWRTACAALIKAAEADPDGGGLVVRTPNGFLQPNVWLGIRNKSASEALRLAAELGMSPVARTRLGKHVSSPDDGKFAGLLWGSGGPSDPALRRPRK